MKTITTLTTVVLLACLLSSCKTAYLSNDFEVAAVDHFQIAVLPIEMIYTGKVHQQWDEEIIHRKTTEESQLFQRAMTNEILRSSKRSNRDLKVKILPANTVLARLAEAGLDAQSSWGMDSKELTKIIGVDALVIGHITKDQRFSDGVSAGADVAGEVIQDIAGDLFGSAGRVLKNNKRVFSNQKWWHNLPTKGLLRFHH